MSDNAKVVAAGQRYGKSASWGALSHSDFLLSCYSWWQGMADRCEWYASLADTPTRLRVWAESWWFARTCMEEIEEELRVLVGHGNKSQEKD